MKKKPTWRSEALNMVAAAIIALLVWAYANDRTREAASVSGTLRLSPSDPRVQFVEPATAVTLAVEVRGSRRAIETFEDAVRTGLSLSIGTDGLSADNGSHVVSLKDVLASNPTVAASGAEVVRVRPETLRYEAGALVTEQVPVAAVLPNTAVRGQISIDPPVVSVTLPEAARKAIGALTVDAAVETRNLEPGKPQQVDVELRLPETLSRWKELCRVVPPRARVSFELLSASSDYTAARVGVRIAMTPDEANRWEVTPEPGSEAIFDVSFSGPRAAIDSLTSGAFTPAAVIDLGGTAPRIGTGSYAVTFWHLPEGVTITKAGTGGTSPVLNLRVMPREQLPRR
jgi:hypothetical protein